MGRSGSLPFPIVALDPRRRRELAQQGRLWLMSVVCALIGSITVWRTGSVSPGVVAFAISLLVLGPLLWTYERRRR